MKDLSSIALKFARNDLTWIFSSMLCSTLKATFFILINFSHTRSYIIIVSIFEDSFRSLFHVKFSEKGSNMRAKEEETYIYFVDFLDECQGWLVF